MLQNFFIYLHAEERVWCQCNHIWGNYVFCRQGASWSKAFCFIWRIFQSHKAAQVNITVSVSPSAAPGYENLRGHRLRHSAGPSAPQGHHRARAWHRRRHQAVQQVCEAGLWAVHWTHHEAGGHCCAQRWDCRDPLSTCLFLVPSSFALRNALHHLLMLFLRWWKHGGHWSDSPACSQPAGGGELRGRWQYEWGWRHRVSGTENFCCSIPASSRLF